MTPNDIEVLIHCHCSPNPHPRIDAIAVRESIHVFLSYGIISEGLKKNTYNTTKKGDALMRLLCRTEFPREVYLDKYDKIIEEEK